MTDLVQICPRLDTELRTVLRKGKHSTNIVFLKAYSYTLGTGWYNNGLALEVATKDPGYLVIDEEDVGRRGRFQGGLGSGP